MNGNNYDIRHHKVQIILKDQEAIEVLTSTLNAPHGSYPSWIVDSGAIEHIIRDREAYVNFCRISHRTCWIYVCKNSRDEIQGVGTCKLDLHGGRILILHDVLYAPKIR